MTPSRRTLVALALCPLLVAPAAEARKERERKARKKTPAAAAAAAIAGCKEPSPVDPQLAEGLAHYGRGDWPKALSALEAWAAEPGAEADPAAPRGLYSLAYVLRTLRGPDSAGAALARALPLLEARTSSAPSLEGWYYLQGLHQMRGDQQAQLTAVAAALRAVDEGGLCATRDGDDWFRLSRLYGFAGNAARKSECLRAAGAAFDGAAGAGASPYRALAEKELGDAALSSNDLAAAEEHFAAAAQLDPSIFGVHRALGLVYLRRGKLQEAADHLRLNWKRERDGGNAFMYAIPIINKVITCKGARGLEPLTGLSQFTVPALEQNALAEGRRFLELRAEQEKAAEAGGPFPDESLREMERAECASLQYLLEYVTRGSDVQEFALQNGLLPVIHGKGLPSR